MYILRNTKSEEIKIAKTKRELLLKYFNIKIERLRKNKSESNYPPTKLKIKISWNNIKKEQNYSNEFTIKEAVDDFAKDLFEDITIGIYPCIELYTKLGTN